MSVSLPNLDEEAYMEATFELYDSTQTTTSGRHMLSFETSGTTRTTYRQELASTAVYSLHSARSKTRHISKHPRGKETRKAQEHSSVCRRDRSVLSTDVSPSTNGFGLPARLFLRCVP